MNSIFSTQNEANSIAQIALTKKQQQENSGAKFGNVLFEKQLTKLSDLANANTMLLAKSSLTAEQTPINTDNLNAQNNLFVLKFSTNQSVSKTNDILLSLLASVNENTANPTLYGYSVDSKGFMGLDFNLAAGLPQDFKIHSSTLEAVHNTISQDYVNKLTAEYYNQSSLYIDISGLNRLPF